MTIREFLENVDGDVAKVLIKHSKPINVFGEHTVPDMTSWRFCDVMDIVGMDMLQAAVKSLKWHTGIEEDDLLNQSASEFASYMKWLQVEAEKIGKLMEQLKKEPDPDMVNSGIDKMDRYGVAAIYYGINRDPSQWDRISEVPFHMMYAKLMMDKDSAEIQENYNRLMMQKQKR